MLISLWAVCRHMQLHGGSALLAAQLPCMGGRCCTLANLGIDPARTVPHSELSPSDSSVSRRVTALRGMPRSSICCAWDCAGRIGSLACFACSAVVTLPPCCCMSRLLLASVVLLACCSSPCLRTVTSSTTTCLLHASMSPGARCGEPSGAVSGGELPSCMARAAAWPSLGAPVPRQSCAWRRVGSYRCMRFTAWPLRRAMHVRMAQVQNAYAVYSWTTARISASVALQITQGHSRLLVLPFCPSAVRTLQSSATPPHSSSTAGQRCTYAASRPMLVRRTHRKTTSHLLLLPVAYVARARPRELKDAHRAQLSGLLMMR